MAGDDIRSTASLAGHSIYKVLMPVPVVCFLGTLFTDLAYAQTAAMQWANMSAWLLTAGLVVAVFAAIALVTGFLGDSSLRGSAPAWIYVLGVALILVLSILNAFVHSRDAYTSVVPTGLTLSAIVAVLMAVTGWIGWNRAVETGQ